MTRETSYIVIGRDGQEISVEKRFDNLDKALEYAKALNGSLNDSILKAINCLAEIKEQEEHGVMGSKDS